MLESHLGPTLGTHVLSRSKDSQRPPSDLPRLMSEATSRTSETQYPWLQSAPRLATEVAQLPMTDSTVSLVG